MKVARLYTFTATHSLPGVPGYDEPHGHRYTVEVVVEAGTMHNGETDDLTNGMIVDTQAIDDVIEPVCADLEGKFLNDEIGSPTTVENLARWFLGVCDIDTGELDDLSYVVVWEDDDRWGSAP